MKEKKWYQKVSNWIFAVVVAILVGVLAINIHITLQAKNNENVVPNIFGYKPFIVLSGSMETQIHVGDLIITKIIDPTTLSVDDVIAFRDQENTVTTHRIIDVVEKSGEKYFVTKGDNNNSQDLNLVEFSDVEGIYVGRIPYVGNVLNEIAKPANTIIIVLGISIIFIILFTKSNKKLRLEEEREFLEYKKQKELLNKNNEKLATAASKSSSGKKGKLQSNTQTKKKATVTKKKTSLETATKQKSRKHS